MMNAKVTGSLKICAPLNDGLDSTRAHHSANLALFFNASSMRLIMLYLEKFSKLLEKILDIVTLLSLLPLLSLIIMQRSLEAVTI